MIFLEAVINKNKVHKASTYHSKIVYFKVSKTILILINLKDLDD